MINNDTAPAGAGESPPADRHETFAVWKLLLLLAATAALYQPAWYFRTARLLKTERGVALDPAWWWFAPLLGPFSVVPVVLLARRLREWSDDERAMPGPFAEPVLVAMFTVIAWLPLMLIMVEPSIVGSIVLMTWLASSVVCLILQRQLNLILGSHEPAPAAAAAFSRRQLAATAVGVLVSVPLYLFAFTTAWETRGAAGLEPETLIGEDNWYRFRIGDAGWSRIDPGYLSADSDMEFLGPDEWTWAIAYDSSGSDTDAILGYRIAGIREDFARADCEQKKSLEPERMIVVGTLRCSGRDLREGWYLFFSRSLALPNRAVEVVAYTSQRSEARYRKMAERVEAFATGLEIGELP